MFGPLWLAISGFGDSLKSGKGKTKDAKVQIPFWLPNPLGPWSNEYGKF